MDVKQAVEEAKAAIGDMQEFRGETYFAILLAKLLAPNSGTPKTAAQLLLASQTTKPYSAPEFFAARRWETDNDKVVLAAYFIERHSAVANYGAQEIKDCLLSAKVPPPANANVAIVRCISRGWMMEVSAKNGKKSWALTQVGERYAESLNKQDD